MLKGPVNMLRTLLVTVFCWPAFAQPAPDLKDILARLDRLEHENRTLRDEVRQLRQDLVSTRAAPQERQEIQDRRLDEQAQTKVEASQKFPLRVTGMALFNAFYGGVNSGNDVPTTASASPGGVVSGATLRQSILGLEFHGPSTFLGGKVRGSLFADFFDGFTEQGATYAQLRTATVEIEWKTRSLMAGLEKPIFNPRNPTSLAQVGYSPMTGSGNLWRWQPQIRFEQRFEAGERGGLRAQLGVLQTSEESGYGTLPATFAGRIERRRPGLEGRFEFFARWDSERRIEIAPGFHFSTSRVGGQSVPSRLFSLDWFANPWQRLEFSGAFFNGQNVAHFGALRQGFRVLADGKAVPVHAIGGWAQLSLIATNRLTFNLFGGQHDDKNYDLYGTGVAQNRVGAANLMFRLAPNVIVGFEGMRYRTTHLGIGNRFNTRYDLAIAYLF